ncbi:ArnT family glycosyltransferase [Vibrio fluvialis]|uniref:ArnT family glycosyltransferase n=1 Tax=Vibrio fluvialis TaxID=676 RepID=UPI001BAFDB20|nr:glycosyltransferase family 39 protein [Vibrio fluvialis]EKO3499261.1 glycosyltransferase family 39 protein [Vibrio fluvialis]EKO3968877.1 glycosyltransferase family 39 protein [Vibrio fluvialis]QUF71228.1 glycosyltransferase family 39 protein [Vibrio fluvialis]
MIKQIYERFHSDDYYKVLSLLMVFAFIIIFAGIGLRSPWPADEPRFAEVAREMVVSGNWFFPMRGGELYPDKPPVFMWAIALVYSWIGNMDWAFMIPNALAGMITLLCVYDLAAKLWNVRVARNAFLLMLIVPQFVLQAKTAQIDAMVACWVTLAMYGFVYHFYIKKNWIWYFASWAFMGLGIITKGVGFLPVFFLIPVIIQVIRHKTPFSLANAVKYALGPLAMLAVIAMWLLPMLHYADISGNPDFTAYKNNILFKQTGERYANSWGHIKPWHYYITGVIPLFWFPVPFMLMSKSYWKNYRATPVIQSLLIWVVLVIIFFSISPGKRGVYVLPAIPMLVLAVSPWMTNFKPHRVLSGFIKGFLWLVCIILLVGAGLALFDSHIITKHLEDEIDTTSLTLFLASAGVIWTLLLVFLRRKSVYCILGSVLACTWLLYSTWGYTLLNPLRTPAKEIMADAAQQIGQDGELGLVKFKEQFLLFSPIPLTQFSYLAEPDQQFRNAWLWMKEKPNRFIMMAQRNDVECFDNSKAKLLGYGHRQSWMLFGQDSLTPTCTPPDRIQRYSMPMPR